MGIHVMNGDSMRITGNYIVAPSGGPSNGIVVEGTSWNNIVQANVTERMTTGLWLVGAGVHDNILLGNLNRSFSLTAILNNGTNNLLANNF